MSTTCDFNMNVNSVVDGIIKFFSEMASLVEVRPFGTVVTFALVAIVVFAFASGLKNVTSKKSNS